MPAKLLIRRVDFEYGKDRLRISADQGRNNLYFSLLSEKGIKIQDKVFIAAVQKAQVYCAIRRAMLEFFKRVGIFCPKTTLNRYVDVIYDMYEIAWGR